MGYYQVNIELYVMLAIYLQLLQIQLLKGDVFCSALSLYIIHRFDLSTLQ